MGETIAWMVSGNAGVVIGVGLLHLYLSGVWCLDYGFWIIVEFMVGILIFRSRLRRSRKFRTEQARSKATDSEQNLIDQIIQRVVS